MCSPSKSLKQLNRLNVRERFSYRGIALLLAWAIVAPSLASAQNFVMDRFVISSGGGTITNGTLSVTGTIGQPDAGVKLAGGSYGLEPGFWSAAIAIQTSGAPLLSVIRVGSTVFISWPTNASGFVLEKTSNLRAPVIWLPVSGVANNSITTPATPGTSFFRLRTP